MPSVTIVVSIFNGSEFIEGSIEYLRQQKYTDFEVIFVVDSKTNDDSVKKIEEFGGKLPEYKVIIQNDKFGLGGSRNIGLDTANGKFIWFLDVDDRPYPDFLSIMVKIIEENHADVSICNYIRSHDRDTPETRLRYKTLIMDREKAMRRLMCDKIPVTTWSKLIRIEFLRKNNLRFSTGFSEDVDHTYMMVNQCSKVVYCSKPLYLYHQNATSIVASLGDMRGKEEIRVYRALMNKFKDTDLADAMRKKAAVMMIRSAGHMTYKVFREFVKSGELKELCDECLRDPPSWDYAFVRISPRLYYLALHIYLKFFYYRELRCYTKV